MNIRWLRIAAVEAREARLFYENERQGLGSEFLAELKHAVERVRTFPKAWPICEEPIRRTVVNRFPYLLHYTLDTDGILIVGVYHSRRAPISWKDRLRR